MRENNSDGYDFFLYDEPHGDEFFIIDKSTSPATWYRLDGTPFTVPPGLKPRTREEIVRLAMRRGWTRGALVQIE